MLVHGMPMLYTVCAQHHVMLEMVMLMITVCVHTTVLETEVIKIVVINMVAASTASRGWDGMDSYDVVE